MENEAPKVSCSETERVGLGFIGCRFSWDLVWTAGVLEVQRRATEGFFTYPENPILLN